MRHLSTALATGATRSPPVTATVGARERVFCECHHYSLQLQNVLADAAPAEALKRWASGAGLMVGMKVRGPWPPGLQGGCGLQHTRQVQAAWSYTGGPTVGGCMRLHLRFTVRQLGQLGWCMLSTMCLHSRRSDLAAPVAATERQLTEQRVAHDGGHSLRLIDEVELHTRPGRAGTWVRMSGRSPCRSTRAQPPDAVSCALQPGSCMHSNSTHFAPWAGSTSFTRMRSALTVSWNLGNAVTRE